MKVDYKSRNDFSSYGNKIKTDDSEIRIIAKMEEPLIVILGTGEDVDLPPSLEQGKAFILKNF